MNNQIEKIDTMKCGVGEECILSREESIQLITQCSITQESERETQIERNPQRERYTHIQREGVWERQTERDREQMEGGEGKGRQRERKRIVWEKRRGVREKEGVRYFSSDYTYLSNWMSSRWIRYYHIFLETINAYTLFTDLSYRNWCTLVSTCCVESHNGILKI